MFKKPAQNTITKSKNPFKKKSSKEPVVQTKTLTDDLKAEAAKTAVQFAVTAVLTIIINGAVESVSNAKERKKAKKFSEPINR